MQTERAALAPYFPSFSEGLSLRDYTGGGVELYHGFPFLFGGTFIEGFMATRITLTPRDFPSFSEGLSLRVHVHL